MKTCFLACWIEHISCSATFQIFTAFTLLKSKFGVKNPITALFINRNRKKELSTYLPIQCQIELYVLTDKDAIGCLVS